MSKRQASKSGDSNGSLFPMDKSTWDSVSKVLALPPQQQRIVELILSGKPDKAIATELELSDSTVRTYLNRIFERTESANRVALVLRIFAIAQQLPPSS